MPTPLSTTVKAFSHYIDQRHVIDRLGKTAAWTLGIAAPAGFLALNTAKAKPEERKAAFIRNGMVLSGVVLASLFAARKWLLKDVLENGTRIGKSFVEQEDVDKAWKTLLQGFEAVKSRKQYQTYKALPELEALVRKKKKSLADFKAIVTHLKTASPETYKQDINRMLPIDLGGKFPKRLNEIPAFLHDEIWEELSEFAILGTVPIAGGILGGMTANKINGEKGKAADMVNEGIFQFISNIFLPVITASLGLTALSIPAVKNRLKQLPNAARFIRFGVIGTSVAVGIGSGMLLANKIGEQWLKPMFDRIQGKPATPQPTAGQKYERKADFWDVFLHVDDFPTALAVAGVKILMPFLPFLFGISGYRAGIGFRNGRKETKAPHVLAPLLSAQASHLERRNQLFQQFNLLKGASGEAAPSLGLAAQAPLAVQKAAPSLALSGMAPLPAFRTPVLH